MEASAIRRQRIARPRARMVSPRVLRMAGDERLVALLRGGNPAAFDVMYERHHRGLLSFARHMLGSREEAEDAIQRTFLSAYAEIIRTDKPIELKPWLYAIARNRCLSILRARRDERSADELEIATEGLSDEVQRRADLRELLVDLRRLPDGQREALVLAEIGALAHDEIAGVIEVPTSKVRALVFQARQSLVASRAARETSCADIREQVANARGAALRRDPLQRHLRDCAGCRDFAGEVKRQRAAMAVLLPVAPSLAFKHGAMPASAAAQAGSAVGLSSAALAPGAVKALAVKALVATAVVGAGAGGVVEIARTVRHDSSGGSATAKLGLRSPSARSGARRTPRSTGSVVGVGSHATKTRPRPMPPAALPASRTGATAPGLRRARGHSDASRRSLAPGSRGRSASSAGRARSIQAKQTGRGVRTRARPPAPPAAKSPGTRRTWPPKRLLKPGASK